MYRIVLLLAFFLIGCDSPPNPNSKYIGDIVVTAPGTQPVTAAVYSTGNVCTAFIQTDRDSRDVTVILSSDGTANYKYFRFYWQAINPGATDTNGLLKPESDSDWFSAHCKDTGEVQ